MDKTKPYGALSPGLAALLDRTSDRGIRDRRLQEQGISVGDHPNTGQMPLFTAVVGGGYHTPEGEKL